MVRYAMFLSYIGTRYRGAARQGKNLALIDLDTIQGALEVACRSAFFPRSTIEPVVYVSSRTDAGVHALGNTVQVELEHPKNLIYNTEYLKGKLNIWMGKCGHDIRISSIYPVTDEFHVRFSAKSRTYMYRVAIAKNSDETRVPITEIGRTWHIRGDIDVDAVRKATTLFMGKRNFLSFSAVNKSRKNINYVKELMDLTFEPASPLLPQDPLSQEFNFWHITVRAKSFLHNQVRRITGALIALATNRITERDIITMLQVPSHKNWNPRAQVAPPQGLYLMNVEYDTEVFNRCVIKQSEDMVDPPNNILKEAY